ncbi:polysaccharide biosynthesis protein, partial [Candidatus Ventrimonas sp. KK005]
IRMLILMALDVGAIGLASFLGLFIRFDLSIEKIPAEYAMAAMGYFPVYAGITLGIFFLFRMYSTMWSVAGIREVVYIGGACGLASLMQIAGMMVLEQKVPRSYFFLSFAALYGSE